MGGGSIVDEFTQPQSDSLEVNIFRKTGLNKANGEAVLGAILTQVRGPIQFRFRADF
jgi:hypothetical protein